jgi:transmembrane sensor
MVGDMQKLTQLVKELHAGSISAEELQQLNEWRAQSPENEAAIAELADPFYIQKEIQAIHQFSISSGAVLAGILQAERSKPAKFPWKWAAIIASVILITGIGYWLNSTRQKRGMAMQEETAEQNSHAEKNSVTLTLSSGKKIDLTRAGVGLAITDASSRIEKSKDGALTYKFVHCICIEGTNAISTPAGQSYSLWLQDGSRVFLYPGSKLEFATDFNSSTRRTVRVSGEAYFEVVQDKLRSFNVAFKKIEFIVASAGFRVQAYGNELIIRATSPADRIIISNGTKVLRPGQALVYDSVTLKLELGEPDAVARAAWKKITDIKEIQKAFRK